MEYGGGKSPCPQVTAAPGLGLTLGSSRHSTRSALHPLHHISPKINQKMIIPSRRSIRRRGSPHSPLVANQGLQKPHFSFYIHLLFWFFFPLAWEVTVSHKSLPQKDLSSLLRASEHLHHQPPSLLPSHGHGLVPAGLEVASTVLPFHGPFQIKRA